MIDGIDLKRPRLNTLKQQLRQQQRPSSMTKTTEYLRSLLTATVLSITFLALLGYTSYTRDDLVSFIGGCRHSFSWFLDELNIQVVLVSKRRVALLRFCFLAFDVLLPCLLWSLI